ncbi:MAG: hypothetical protein Q8R47_06795 [Nanoarchaeota archaeon]|nr:hypothetical protein [Nanoarchaeota archaeon]
MLKEAKQNKMKINIRNLLKYFDTRTSTVYGDTTAVMSVVGEDLGATLFKHYCENERKSKVEIVDPNEEIPTEGKKIGRRLDRWILEKTKNNLVLYQAEIKSWSSRAIGGITIPVDISEEELRKKIKQNWNRNVALMNDKRVNGLNKVLVEMPTDKKLDELGINGPYNKAPLLIFWDARNSKGDTDCFSKYNIKKKQHNFNYCWIFSCSLYLRHLHKKGIKDLQIVIPNAERRINRLNSLFKV